MAISQLIETVAQLNNAGGTDVVLARLPASGEGIRDLEEVLAANETTD